MNRIQSYGPALVLGAVAASVLVGGPTVVRRLAHAEQQAETEARRQRLKHSGLSQLNGAFKDVARVVEPSVVHIEVARRAAAPEAVDDARVPEEFRRFFRERRRSDPRYDEFDAPHPQGNGSGWVYGHGNGQHYIITNHHVVEGADSIRVKFYDKTTRKAELVGADPKTDIAVLRVEGNALHAAAVAEAPVEKGEIVFAFGSPFQFEFSISQGIVMGKGRQIGILAQRRGYENFIQTDAAVNPGNSGGPLTNIHGEVVGMNTAIPTTTGGFNGMAFTIPVDMIRNVADQLIDTGVVHRGYLGVWIRDLDAKLARTFGFEGEGVLVEDLVADDSPAALAGIRAGDIITKINGKPIGSSAQLRRTVAAIAPGQDTAVEIFRNGETLTRTVHLTELPDASRVASRPAPRDETGEAEAGLEPLRQLGLERLESLDAAAARRRGLDFTPGVLVVSVRAGSVADAAGLRPGSVITGIMGQPVRVKKDLAEALQGRDLKSGVRLRIRTGAVSHYVLLALPE